MRRYARVAGGIVALGLILVACGGAKDTGLPASPTPEPKGGGNTITVIDNMFEPKTLEVKVGAEIAWVFEGTQPHNVKADSGLFDSHPACSGAAQDKCSKKGDPSFKFTFKDAGEVQYFCVIHGFQGGVGMSGKIIVKA